MGPRDVRVVREFLSVKIVRILSDKLYRTYNVRAKGPKVYLHVHELNKYQKATDLNNRKVALWSSE